MSERSNGLPRSRSKASVTGERAGGLGLRRPGTDGGRLGSHSKSRPTAQLWLCAFCGKEMGAYMLGDGRLIGTGCIGHALLYAGVRA